MAENGTTKGSMMAAIQSAQMAVGSAIKGSAGAVSTPADMEQVSILDKIKEISHDTRESIESMANTMAEALAFDKEKFRREMDMAREAEKERLKAMSNSDAKMFMPTKEEATGGFGKLALGGIAALAAFAKALNVDEILRLPQQLKSIRAMATFAKGVGTIATLGFGPKIIDALKAFFKSFDLKKIQGRFANLFEPLIKKFDDFKKGVRSGRTFTFFDSVTDFFRNIGTKVGDFVKAIRNNKVLIGITKGIGGAFATIRATLTPVINSIKGLFSGGSSVLGKILGPLKTLGRTIGRLFLPVTLILGVIDGVQGFMKEFGETGSILDGIRGAVMGIVDGFIGGLVRLVGSAVEYIFSFLGLDNLGKAINEKINALMDNFLTAIGGITDLITGLFTFDGERIMSGLGAMFSGVGGFFLNILSAPIDLAVNFIKDIFGFGDPDKPFSIKGFLLGDETQPGIIGRIWNWFKGLFTFDFSGIKSQFGGIWSIMKGLAAGGWAAVKAMLPGGESPGEAFNRVFSEYVDSGTLAAAAGMNTSMSNEPEITRVTTENTAGDVVTTTTKTNTINQGATNNQGATIVNAPATTVNNQQSTSANTINATNLRTSTDPYYDREAWAYSGGA